MNSMLYSGSFDPITLGHIDIIKRAYELCDHLYIGVGYNAQKTYMFNMEERIQMVKGWIGDLARVTVVEVPGLTAEKARELECSFLVRGVRNGSDLDREMQIARINQKLYYVNTLFLPAIDKEYISSSAVKELAILGADLNKLKKFVTAPVADILYDRASKIRVITKQLKKELKEAVQANPHVFDDVTVESS